MSTFLGIFAAIGMVATMYLVVLLVRFNEERSRMGLDVSKHRETLATLEFMCSKVSALLPQLLANAEWQQEFIDVRALAVEEEFPFMTAPGLSTTTIVSFAVDQFRQSKNEQLVANYVRAAQHVANDDASDLSPSNVFWMIYSVACGAALLAREAKNRKERNGAEILLPKLVNLMMGPRKAGQF